MSRRRVGIIGGMGPEATVLLMQRLIAAVKVEDDGDHIPLIVDMNPQVPSRIQWLIERNGEDPAPVLAGMARRLEAAGAEALAMPCNTAHHFTPDIRAATSLPFIDMVGLSVARVRRLADKVGRVGILASPAVQRIGLFDRMFADAGLQAVFPADGDALLDAIRTIKAEGPTSGARERLAASSEKLLAEGAVLQMIACTEFSLLPEALSAGAIAVDTLDVLVEGVVAFACGEDAPGKGA
jgi:aspartate racemase